MKTLSLISSLIGAGMIVGVTSVSAQVLAFDFEIDTSAQWDVFQAHQGSADFNYDYSAVGVPLSPNSKPSDSTKALRLDVNWDHNTSGQYPGVSVSPIGFSAPGDFVLTFDIWSNSVGPITKGAGAGATMINGAGIGTNATGVTDPFNPLDSLFFMTDNEGDVGSTNYRVYPAANQTEGVGYLVAGTGAHTNDHYSSFGGVEAPAAQLALYPGQTGTTAIGVQGMEWHTWEIKKEGDTVTWSIDDIAIAIVTDYSDLGLTGDNILFNRFDPFWGASADVNGPALNFTLIDNVSIVPEPSTYAMIFGGLALIGAFIYRRRK